MSLILINTKGYIQLKIQVQSGMLHIPIINVIIPVYFQQLIPQQLPQAATHINPLTHSSNTNRHLSCKDYVSIPSSYSLQPSKGYLKQLPKLDRIYDRVFA